LGEGETSGQTRTIVLKESKEKKRNSKGKKKRNRQNVIRVSQKERKKAVGSDNAKVTQKGCEQKGTVGPPRNREGVTLEEKGPCNWVSGNAK